MNKDTLLAALKSESMLLTAEEIEGIMNEELEKSPEEMDTQLIDLCADVLDKAYFGTEEETIPQEDIQKYENIKTRTKRIKFGKVLLIAVVFVVIVSIAVPVSARYVHNEASDKIVHFFIDHFNFDLRDGNKNAINHSNESIDIVKQLKDAGFGDIILPSVLLEDDYSIKNIDVSEDENFLSADIDFESKTTKLYGYIGIIKCKNETYEFIMGTRDVADDFDSVKQLQVNGMDILIFSNEERGYIAYNDKNIDYSIHISNFDLDTGIKIAKSLE